jgi:hypothetical protein
MKSGGEVSRMFEDEIKRREEIIKYVEEHFCREAVPMKI